jgi:hypothetical protein
MRYRLAEGLRFIVYTLSSSARVKWLFSSRNELYIEQKLRSADKQATLSLELKENAEQVSRAVDMYIDDKLSRLDSLQDEGLRDRVRLILRQKANSTFLWVALVIQELERPENWDPLQVVEDVPMDLHQLYDRMMNQIQQLMKRHSEVCQLILSIATVAYRPLYLAEIGSLCELLGQISALTKNLRKIVTMCGSFLTIRDDQIYLIHQSAKDYLSDEIFPSPGKTNHDIVSRSLEFMSSTLQRDLYCLTAPDFQLIRFRCRVKTRWRRRGIRASTGLTTSVTLFPGNSQDGMPIYRMMAPSTSSSKSVSLLARGSQSLQEYAGWGSINGETRGFDPGNVILRSAMLSIYDTC